MFDLNIPLQQMETLEEKYGIALHVDQYADKKDEYFMITKDKEYKYVGSTIKEVKKKLKKIYGY